MATATQLVLFDDTDAAGECPHCGFKAPLRAFVSRRRQQVLAHPRVQALPASTREFVSGAPDTFLAGALTGVAIFEQQTAYTRSAAYKQLRKLARRGLVEMHPKRPGGQYYLYRFILFSNGNWETNRKHS